MFRYWDGSVWSAELSSSPTAPAPTSVGGLGFKLADDASSAGSTPLPGQSYPMASGNTVTGSNPFESQPRKRGVSVGLMVLGALLALLLLGGAFFIFHPGSPLNNPDHSGNLPKKDICPKQAEDFTPRLHPADDRVHGGKLSFPKQRSPWSAPHPDTRVPFGVDVLSQVKTVERNYNGRGSDWVSSLLVGLLNSGDGFYGPQEGSEIVARCVLGKFYSDAKITREDKKSEAMTIDGHDAWQLEMHLAFSIKGLKNKGETAIIVVVNNNDSTASLYYASIPDSEPDDLRLARDLLTQLKMDS